MKWISQYKPHPDSSFIIETDIFYDSNWQNPTTHYRFYGIPGDDGEKIDTMQDTLHFAKDDALEYFGVPMDSWAQVE